MKEAVSTIVSYDCNPLAIYERLVLGNDINNSAALSYNLVANPILSNFIKPLGEFLFAHTSRSANHFP
ncbi:MAG: hypothetical protein AAB209_07270 [Bacteroidota bacterium]